VFFKRTPQLQPLPDIPVWTAMDRVEPWLTSMALLSSDRLVVVDPLNQSVKLLDVVQDKVRHQLKVDDIPTSVCSLPGNRAAVILPYRNTLLIMDCENQLSIVSTITVQGKCEKVAYSNGHLIVLYEAPVKVAILHLNERVVKQKVLEISTYLFHNLLSVTTEGDVTSIFVSDFNNSSILRLDEDLQEQQVYPVPDGAEPGRVLAVGENQLLVNDFDDRLWQLDSTMGSWTHLIQRKWNICEYPMAFCHDRHVLYSGGWKGVQRFAIS